MKLRKKIVVMCLAFGFVLGMAGPATAHHTPRADGVCGGVGATGHYNPVTGECE
ncbi:MAG: hypothetical protein ABR540_12290 [Acidimicrobiales bacterium]